VRVKDREDKLKDIRAKSAKIRRDCRAAPKKTRGLHRRAASKPSA